MDERGSQRGPRSRERGVRVAFASRRASSPPNVSVRVVRMAEREANAVEDADENLTCRAVGHGGDEDGLNGAVGEGGGGGDGCGGSNSPAEGERGAGSSGDRRDDQAEEVQGGLSSVSDESSGDVNAEQVDDKMRRYYYKYFSTSFHRIAQAIHSIPYLGPSVVRAVPMLNSGLPIYVLGQRYERQETETLTLEEADRLTADLFSRPWVTYRTSFPCFSGSDFSSDVGWGCALRSGQMVVAQFLLTHRLGRAWRRGDTATWDEAKGLLRCFRDAPDDRRSPFSIHNIMASGRELGVNPGNWLGPYVLCQCFASLFRRQLWDEMRSFVVTQDSGGAPTLFVDNVMQVCLGADGETWKPVLILVPLVLGPFKHINPTYAKPLLATFSFPQSLGIVGGRTNASHYFIGCQGDSVLFMDPHTVQAAAMDADAPMSDEEAATYFCSDIRTMEVTAMSPSLAVAFHCETSGDFDDLVGRLRRLEGECGCAPLLTVQDKEPPPRDDSAISMDEESDEDPVHEASKLEGGGGSRSDWHLV